MSNPDSLPTSFGVFKPVGHLMLGLPAQAQADALALELQDAGWPADAVVHFTPSETEAEMAAMLDNASGLAGFGYEITLLRRYLDMARAGPALCRADY